jgi:hypothetical protein
LSDPSQMSTDPSGNCGFSRATEFLAK